MSKTIAILHVIDNLEVGGAQEVLYNYGAAIDKKRFSFTICVLAGTNAYSFAPSVDVRILSRHKYQIWLIIGRLFRLLATGPYDIVHLHLYYSKLLTRLLIALFFRTKFKVIIHDHNAMDTEFGRPFLYPVVRWIEKRLYAVTDAVVCCSEYVRTFDLATFHYNPERCLTLYNCIRIEGAVESMHAKHGTLERIRAETPGLLFGVMARFYPYKKIDDALRAFAEFVRNCPQQHPAVLCIAGDGPQQKQLQALTKELGIAERVFFLGFLKSEYRYTFYQAIDCLLISSIQESFSLVAVEALANGTPVIAPGVGGIIEVVNNGAFGFLFDRAKPGALTKALEHFSDQYQNHRQACDTMMQEAYRYVMQHFSADVVIKKLEDCYTNVYNNTFI